jgi:hypothetical protein
MTVALRPFDAYKLYVAITTHFKSDSYDIRKYQGRVSASETSFLRRNDASFFYTACKLYPTKEKWSKAIVANVLEDNEYVVDIIKNENVVQDYIKRRENMARHYQEDLRKLLDLTRKLDHLFVENYDTTDPLIISMIHQREISYESAVLMNEVFRWLNMARSNDTLLWPLTRRKIQKYGAFFNVNYNKYKDLTTKVIKNHI